jgi:hypothetical protein
MLKQFEGKYLAVLEEDDTLCYSKEAGLPVPVLKMLQLLQSQAVDSKDQFLRSPALFEVFSYVRSIPEGLIPSFFACKVLNPLKMIPFLDFYLCML